MGKIYVNDVGKELRVNVGKDITTATTKKLYIKKPVTGTEIEVTASAYDATHMTYTTITGQLDEAGDYELNSYAEWGPTSKHTGETARFTVYKRYK